VRRDTVVRDNLFRETVKKDTGLRPLKTDAISIEDARTELAKEPQTYKSYTGLWVLAILLFGFGDTLLSTMVFAKGGYEANPLMGNLVTMLGGSMISFVIIKTVVVVVLALISFKFFKKHGWLIPAILIVIGAFLVISNFMAYIKMK
jgi:hypothetical protein